ncbi:hypothetical protein SLS53_004126 [Cytospora paraplurivora]|uniref:Zn(2)-C6 fungal-type domain-containing protein n=1 Tax=Cytospora paraplurivora TaxID=2898453 RepID=A0AAN9U986_9PEZI
MTLSLLPRDQEPRLSDASISRAAQACTTCRKQKRRCDKALPACSRCASLQKVCDYAEAAGTPTAPTAEAFASLQAKLAEIEARLDATTAAVAHKSPAPSGVHGSSGSGTVVVGESSSSPGDLALEGTAGSSGGAWTGNSHAVRPLVRLNFPALLFLDSDVYKLRGLRMPKPNVDIPMGVLEILAPPNVIEDAASSYFSTIHRWFPFISRKRMNLGLSLHDSGPDLALLFLTIKLITTPPDPDLPSAADSHLYTTSKSLLALLESAGTLSILYLQALILATLYELGHGIYPAAWMTSGAAVRYAAMLGLPSYQESCRVLGQCATWTEAEERRRVWWAAHVLDRVVSIGSRRPFAGGPDPPPGADLLPVDDRAWDEGDVSGSLQRPVGTPAGERGAISPFARLAQVSVLISKAMAHCRRATTRYARSKGQGRGRDRAYDGKDAGPSTSTGGNVSASGGAVGDEKPYDIREATDVLMELRTLCQAISADMVDGGGLGSGAYFALAPSRCLTWSTSVMVLDLYSCPEHMRPGAGTAADETQTEGELAMQVEAINGLVTASETARVFAGEVLAITSAGSPDGVVVGGGGGGASCVSPLCLDALYCAMATFHWQWKESGRPEVKQGMDEMRAALARLTPRWRLAGEYLEIGKQHEVTNILGARTNGTS